MSTSDDCTNLQLVGDNGSAGKVFDLNQGPTLFSGSPAAGTYKCVAMKMDDTFTLIPDSTAAASLPGLCVAGTETKQDIYRAGSTDFKAYDGTAITGRGVQDSGTNSPVADKVFIVGSTTVSSLIARGYSSNQAITLANARVVPGQATLSLNLLSHIEYSTNRCGMSQIPMSFE